MESGFEFLHSITAPGDPPLSIDELSEWRLSSVSEWQSTCHHAGTNAQKKPGSSQACHCSATHVCGPYFVVELSRRCGCYRSIQVRANGHNERFVFLDDLPFSTDYDSGDPGAGSSDVRIENIPDNVSSTSPISSSFKTTESFTKDLFSSKPFSLVDLAFLLGAIKHEHAEHRWTDAYADRSLIDFSIAEVFVFLRYFFEGDLRSQVKEHRRSIAKTFYDRRVDTWNSVSSRRRRFPDVLSIDTYEFFCLSSGYLVLLQIHSPYHRISGQRRVWKKRWRL